MNNRNEMNKCNERISEINTIITNLKGFTHESEDVLLSIEKLIEELENEKASNSARIKSLNYKIQIAELRDRLSYFLPLEGLAIDGFLQNDGTAKVFISTKAISAETAHHLSYVLSSNYGECNVQTKETEDGYANYYKVIVPSIAGVNLEPTIAKSAA